MVTPKTIQEVYEDYRGRREGLLKALMEDAELLLQQCDPQRENLCLYGHPDGTWSVGPPCEEVPPEIPEPVLGINFAIDGMERRDWLALCAVHSDAWLMGLAFFYAARFDVDGRAELFSFINQHPTLYEVSTGRVARSKVYKRKVPKHLQAAAAAAAAAQQQQQAAEQQYDATAMAVEPLSLPQFAGKPCSADQPSEDGRMLLFEDINLGLVGRQAELFWPDDGKWYLIEIQAVEPASRKANVQYATGETETLDLDEVVRDGHMSLLAAPGGGGAAQ